MTHNGIIKRGRADYKNVFIEKFELARRLFKMDGEIGEEEVIEVYVRPHRAFQKLCPICMKRCPSNGHKQAEPSEWRDSDIGQYKVILIYRPYTIICPEHGSHREYLPWADGDTRFTASFNDEVAWLALRMSKTDVKNFMRISWATVGHSMSASWKRYEVSYKDRIRGVRHICVDETSIKKGHKYITIVIDMDKHQVIWIEFGHDFDTFSKFCELMTEEERNNVEVVAGDGASWIDKCVNIYFPNATRCMDPFHVTQWVTKALDQVRASEQDNALKEYRRIRKAFEKQEAKDENIKRRKKVNKNDDENNQRISEEDLQKALKAVEVTKAKGLRYALIHNPENRTSNQNDLIELVKLSSTGLYKAYELKEKIRVIIHMRDAEAASEAINEWIEEASTCGLNAMVELAASIKSWKDKILNSIRLGANSAQSEANNTTVKALVTRSRGFASIQNAMDMVYMCCSNVSIPVNPRISLYDKQKEKRRNKMKEYRERKRIEKYKVALSKLNKSEPMYDFYKGMIEKYEADAVPA